MSTGERFDRFTARAREALSLAESEARHCQQTALGVEHLLLGVLKAGRNLAVAALGKLNITPAVLCAAVEECVENGPLPTIGSLSLTPDAKRSIEYAVDEALRLAARGPEYLG